ncbi:MAG: hypothetical protein JWM85_2636 [Acidimicrobiaceae bacterium]|nr:hypothetical protein [Acidimicrobiaceae bacterium]
MGSVAWLWIPLVVIIVLVIVGGLVLASSVERKKLHADRSPLSEGSGVPIGEIAPPPATPRRPGGFPEASPRSATAESPSAESSTAQSSSSQSSTAQSSTAQSSSSQRLS